MLYKIFSFFLPPACPQCLRSLYKEEKLFCQECFSSFEALPICNCLEKLSPDAYVFSLFFYNAAMKKIMRILKFHEGLHYCKALAESIEEKLLSLLPYCMQSSFYLDEKDKIFLFKNATEKEIKFFRKKENPFQSFEKMEVFLVPMPLHEKRKKERGYNQIEEIFKDFQKDQRFSKTKKLKIETEKLQFYLAPPNFLLRIKETERQTEQKDKLARRKNVEKAFYCQSFLCTAEQRKKALFFIVDDVMSTGATLENAIKAMKKAGICHAMGLAIAKEP